MSHPTVIGVTDWMKRTSLPGFFGVPIYDILYFLNKEFQRNALQVRANSIAFSFMLACFPATIVIFSLLPYFPISNFVDIFEENLVEIVPVNVKDQIMVFIRDITDVQRSGLLSTSFLLALFFASNGMMALLDGFEKKHQERLFLSRNFFIERMVAIRLTILLSFILFSSVILIVAGNYIIEWLVHYIEGDSFTKNSFWLLKWFTVIFFFYAGITTIYRYGPAVKRRFPIFSPGATLATLLSIISSQLFSYFVNNFGTYNELYGSLGVLIVFMLWLKINAFILLVGFELNAAIAVNRDLKEVDMEEVFEEQAKLEEKQL